MIKKRMHKEQFFSGTGILQTLIEVWWNFVKIGLKMQSLGQMYDLILSEKLGI